MTRFNRTRNASLALTILALVGCSSSGSDDPPPSPPPPPPPPAVTYSVGGTASGLSGSAVLQLNGANNLTVSAAGAFTFPTNLASGSAYAVTVLTQPAGQTCAVGGGTGTVASANISSVTLDCTSTGGSGFTVGGMVSGLSGNVVLRLNGANDLTVSAPGAFEFPIQLAAGATYAVTFAALPDTQVCGLSAATGTIASADVTNVAVNCTAFTIGGSVMGLNGSGLVVQLNGGNDLPVATGSTSFTFPSTASLGGTLVYNLHVQSQPAGQTCTIVRAVGFVTPAAPNANTTAVACSNNVFNPLSGTYQLTMVDGVAMAERGFATFYRDGTYIFAIHSDDSDCDANNGNGLEYGVYRWNSTTNAFAFVTSALDTNGGCGIADGNARLQGTMVKNANGTLSADFLDNNGSGDHVLATLTPVASVADTLIGSWGNNQIFTTFDANGHLFSADSRWPVQIAATSAGIEDGCYLLSGSTTSGSFTVDFSGTCAVSATQTAIDTSGVASGLSVGGNQARNFNVSGDDLQFLSPTGAAGLTVPRITTD